MRLCLGVRGYWVGSSKPKEGTATSGPPRGSRRILLKGVNSHMVQPRLVYRPFYKLRSPHSG